MLIYTTTDELRVLYRGEVFITLKRYIHEQAMKSLLFDIDVTLEKMSLMNHYFFNLFLYISSLKHITLMVFMFRITHLDICVIHV